MTEPGLPEVTTLTRAREIIREERERQLSLLPARKPRTRAGKAIRSLRKALDRRALAAVLYMGEVIRDGVVAGVDVVPREWRGAYDLLDTSRLDWKAARRLGLLVEEDEEWTLTQLGQATLVLLKAGDEKVIAGGFTITWERLLKASGPSGAGSTAPR